MVDQLQRLYHKLQLQQRQHQCPPQPSRQSACKTRGRVRARSALAQEVHIAPTLTVAAQSPFKHQPWHRCALGKGRQTVQADKARLRQKGGDKWAQRGPLT